MEKYKLIVIGHGNLGQYKSNEILAAIKDLNVVMMTPDEFSETGEAKLYTTINRDQIAESTMLAASIDTKKITMFTPPLTRAERRKQQRKKGK